MGLYFFFDFFGVIFVYRWFVESIICRRCRTGFLRIVSQEYIVDECEFSPFTISFFSLFYSLVVVVVIDVRNCGGWSLIYQVMGVPGLLLLQSFDLSI